ncbi:ComEA family DNA-binding protein [Rubrivirga sp. IMCC43871]|uniref:ComEA family DNA-binding protein n=1 Tax=Rubrivirga sp. IMCC43871 TaxID=3391575 RepID=UPI00398FDFFC
MRWLYRLQTRVGLTGPEGSAALAVLVATLGGAVALHVQGRAQPVPADLYAAADAAFATVAADTAATPAAPLALAAPAAEPESAGDSTAAQVADAAVERASAPRRSGKPPPVPTNVNTASEADLQRLPRIGPALAGRIVAYRRAHGPFRSADQLAEVKGIGAKTVEQLRPWVRL